MNLSISLYDAEHTGLAWGFHVSPDSCDNPEHYEQYIRFMANTDKREGMGVTHMLVDEEAERMAGFLALRLSSLFYVGEDGNAIGNPALEIAELAVDKDYERRGCGTILVDLAMYLGDVLRTEYAGVKYLLACADPAAVGFYKKKGFHEARELYEVPRDGSNNNCIPMYLKLPSV